ncbi:helix-turn-helix domain-containing protein [Paenibacillus silvisoli]|uniref:helix-turn-helix domain-containing protein n=1 Tax=Paenibacillus silvisoli TaxID=3110539 RepID=UPI002804288C|nr:helix-turn-helix domain-containing protein [Paenibacillus silvisoli]
MKALTSWLNRTYFKQIALSVTLLSVISIIVSSGVLFYNSQKTILSVQKEANLKVLNQIQYNVDNTNQVLKQIASSSYFDSDTIYLANTTKIVWSELSSKLWKLNQILSSSPLLESITVYNPNLQCYFSTNYTNGCADDGTGGVISSFLAKQSFAPPKFKLIPLKSDQQNDSRIERFLYFLYVSLPGETRPSILILSVKPEWLTDNLHKVQNVDLVYTSNLMIFNQQGLILQSSPSPSADKALLLSKIEDFKHHKENNYFIDKLGGKRSIITFVSSQSNDWYIASVQDYSTVYQGTARLTYFFIMILLVFICLSILVSSWIARRLYKPVQSMLTDLSNSELPSIRSIDEFAIIRNRYTTALHSLEQLRSAQDSRDHNMKGFYLRKWLLDSTSLTEHELHRLFDQTKLNAANPRFAVCVLKVDEYRDFKSKLSAPEQSLLLFAACNIAQEIVGDFMPNVVTDMQGEHIVIVAQVNSNGWYEILHERLREIQSAIHRYYQISLSAALVHTASLPEQISASYTLAQDNANYRFVYGKGSLITHEMISNRLETVHLGPLTELEKKLSNSLKANDQNAIENHLSEIEYELSRLPYHHIVHAILHAVSVVVNTIREINTNSISQISLDTKRFYDVVLEQETLQDTIRAIGKLLNETSAMRQQDKQVQTNALLVETIKEIVESQLSDQNLSVALIADMLRISSAQTNKIFKEHMGLAIHEYLHEMRLEKAKALLEADNRSVNDIMLMAGFGNQSYFFRLFKKKYSVTPREYRLKVVLGDKPQQPIDTGPSS